MDRTVFLSILRMAAAAILLLFSPCLPAEGREYSALLLHSYHSGFAWTDGINEGIQKAFDSAGMDVKLSVEYMDSKRSSAIRTVSAFSNYFDEKYAGRKPDVILCSDDDALAFILRRTRGRGSLGDVPVVFCGVNNPDLPHVGENTHVTGVFEQVDISGTVSLILQTFPRTKGVALVSDLTPSAMAVVNQARRELAKFQGRLSFTDLFGLTGRDLQDQISLLTPDTAVLVMVFFQDEEGTFYSSERTADLLREAGPFPAFGLWSMMVEGGLLGGSVIVPENHGAAAGEIAVRILKGTPPSAIKPVTDTHLVPVFNYGEGARFGLSSLDIPAGALLFAEPESFFYRNRKAILVAGGVVVFALIYLTVLFANERRRGAAEKALRLKTAQWEALFENAPEAYAIFDGDNSVLRVNESFNVLFGYGEREAEGKVLDELVSGGDPDVLSDAADLAAKVFSGEPVTRESLRKKKDGTAVDLEIMSIPLPSGEDASAGFILYRDISGRKKNEREAMENLRREGLISSVSATLLEKGATGGIPPSLEELASFLGVTDGGVVETDGEGNLRREFHLSEGKATALPFHETSLNLSPEELDGLAGILQEEGRLLLEEETLFFGGDSTLAAALRSAWGVPLEVRPLCHFGPVRAFLALKMDRPPLSKGDEALLAAFCELTGNALMRERRREITKELNEKLDGASRGVVEILGRALSMKDPFTVGHQINVARLAKAMALKGGRDEAFQERVYYGGLVHDLGKISIPSAILSKPGKLIEVEFSIIKEHARLGREILASVDAPWPLAEMAGQHHERMDGSGYPKGLKGEAICREARFLAVADVVEAMTSHRPYRPGLGMEKALEEIRRYRGVKYDPEAVDLCVAVVEEELFQLDHESYRHFLT